jgi:hypothetical protein
MRGGKTSKGEGRGRAGRERRETGQGGGKGLSPPKVNILVTSLFLTFMSKAIKRTVNS